MSQLSLVLAVRPLLAVFSFLPGRAAAMCASDVAFFLGFSFNLSAVALVVALCLAEHQSAASNYFINIVHLV